MGAVKWYGVGIRTSACARAWKVEKRGRGSPSWLEAIKHRLHFRYELIIRRLKFFKLCSTI